MTVIDAIKGLVEGSQNEVLSAKTLGYLGNRTAIDQALSRLCRLGLIKRAARGLYVHPEAGLSGPGEWLFGLEVAKVKVITPAELHKVFGIGSSSHFVAADAVSQGVLKRLQSQVGDRAGNGAGDGAGDRRIIRLSSKVSTPLTGLVYAAQQAGVGIERLLGFVQGNARAIIAELQQLAFQKAAAMHRLLSQVWLMQGQGRLLGQQVEVRL